MTLRGRWLAKRQSRLPLRLAILAVILLVTLVTTGCGGGRPLGSLGADEVLKRAVAATQRQLSVRVQSSGGTYQPRLGAVFEFSRTGDATGTFSLEGERMDFVLVANRVYVRGGASFNAGQLRRIGVRDSATVALLSGKYLTNTSDDLTNVIRHYRNGLPLLSENLRRKLGAGATLTRGRTVNGVSTIGVEATGSDGKPTRIYVAEDGSDLPLLEVSATMGTTKYSEWGSVGAVSPPPSDSVVDLDDVRSTVKDG